MRAYRATSREEVQSLQPFRAATWHNLLGNVHHLAADRGGQVLSNRYCRIELTDAALADIDVILMDSQPSQEHWQARLCMDSSGPRWGVTRIEWQLGFADGLGAVTWSPTWTDQLPDLNLGQVGHREYGARYDRLSRWCYPEVELGSDAPPSQWSDVRSWDLPTATVGFDFRTLHVQARIDSVYGVGQRFWARGLMVWGSVQEGMV